MKDATIKEATTGHLPLSSLLMLFAMLLANLMFVVLVVVIVTLMSPEARAATPACTRTVTGDRDTIFLASYRIDCPPPLLYDGCNLGQFVGLCVVLRDSFETAGQMTRIR